jgi:protocatechuate 3,4-dioxygenase beta subunit
MKKLSRRQVVLGMGAVGAGAMLPSIVSVKRSIADIKPSSIPSCTMTPEQTEGPFYFETKLIRRDISEGRPGTTLHLKLKVVESGSCKPIQDAVVDIWSCDALGEYSGYETANFNLPPRGGQPGRRQEGTGEGDGGAPRQDNGGQQRENGRPGFHQEPQNEKTFLRGAQVTNAEGEVEFKTIYPGWYQGRATHIHVKVYLENDDVLTSQMYFPEELNDRVYQHGIYAEHEGSRLKNNQDGIFKRAGNGPVLDITMVEEGIVGTMTLGVNKA